MLELGAGADILRAVGWLYLSLMVLLIGAALWFPERWWQKGMGALVVLLVFAGPAYLRGHERAQLVDEHKARYEKARAVFEERCKTAGEKIYRTVDDVEGVLLLNLRPNESDADRHDPNWPDAGLPEQFGGESYIANFLKWEHSQGSRRGALNRTPSGPADLPGYRYADFREKGGLTWRYTPRKHGDPDYPLLARTELNSESARYAVSFINLIDPEDRKLWVAGTTVTVSDTKTSEVLAQATWYSFAPSLGARNRHSAPWSYATSCPIGGGERAPIRYFVDQVLKPKKGD